MNWDYPPEMMILMIGLINKILSKTGTEGFKNKNQGYSSEILYLYATPALVGPANGMISVFLNPAADAQRSKSESV